MKILKDNCKKAADTTTKANTYPRKLICELCESELEYEESDIRIGVYGAAVVDCPCCGRDNIIDDDENSIVLTVDNVEFPTHFHHTSEATGAVDCCNTERIRKFVRQAIDYFRKNKNEFVWLGQTGNLYIAVYRYEGDKIYEVVVSNDFYETEIPFAPQDY